MPCWLACGGGRGRWSEARRRIGEQPREDLAVGPGTSRRCVAEAFAVRLLADRERQLAYGLLGVTAIHPMAARPGCSPARAPPRTRTVPVMLALRRHSQPKGPRTVAPEDHDTPADVAGRNSSRHFPSPRASGLTRRRKRRKRDRLMDHAAVLVAERSVA